MKKQTALMNHWQLCQYLRKLHLPQVVPPPDLATLKLLQDAHLKYVPYENLDILSGRLTSLEHDDMFAKIIMKNRGGICFELNGCIIGCWNPWAIKSQVMLPVLSTGWRNTRSAGIG